MMNEKIFKYCEGEMSPGEKAGFEKELENSVELRAGLEKYRRLIVYVREGAEISADESYFNGIVPEFRKRMDEAAKKKYHPVYSFAGAVATVIIFFMLLPVGQTDIGDRLNNFSSSEISDYLYSSGEQQSAGSIQENLPDNYGSLIESALDNKISAELSQEVSATVYNSVDFNTLVETINNSEADHIYAAMINKKIF